MADRSTYRMQEDQQLIEEAKYNPNRELAIVLGERLEDFDVETNVKVGEMMDRASDAEREASKLDDKIYELQMEIDKLELMLEERNRIIDELKKGN
jgi:TolA-binding protein